MDDSLRYYRERLETYLGQPFAKQDWQAMVALGYTVAALNWVCFAVNFYKMDQNLDNRAWFRNSVEIHGHSVMDAIRWL